MRNARSWAVAPLVIALALALGAARAATVTPASAADDEWTAYGRDAGGQRSSPLRSIDTHDVQRLRVAWTFHTGDAYQPKGHRPTAFEATPLYVDGTLFVATPLGRVFALDPTRGAQRWVYDGKVPRDAGFGDFATRGLGTWRSPAGERRLFLATIDARLVALDARTGAPVDGFGTHGVVDLRRGLRIAPREDSFADYEETSPPAVVGDVIVLGSGVADNDTVAQPSGEVRGFDVRSGRLLWTWDPIPQDAHAPGADSWTQPDARARTGAANAWSVIAADPARDLVFVPTSSPSPDYYGGLRLGDDRAANSLVALRASTGALVWQFQLVHHDLWDYDTAFPPILLDVHRDGRTIPAVAIASKDGNLFLLDRTSGAPLVPVVERPVPASDVPGETASPTQPFPPPALALARQALDPAAIAGNDADRAWCRDEIAKLRNEGVFTPPSLRGSLIVPGNIGGMAWSGAAYDAAHRLLVLPVNELAAEVRLLPRAEVAAAQESAGRSIGGPWEIGRQLGTPYAVARRFLVAPGGWPCTPPPWGELVALDVDAATVRWRVPLGRMPSLGSAPPPPPEDGAVSLGGPIVTAGGLVFQAGTVDRAIRAFDVASGRELWSGELPTSARSTPMTYRGPDGKQYVVIAAGGHGLPVAPLDDALVAFALGD